MELQQKYFGSVSIIIVFENFSTQQVLKKKTNKQTNKKKRDHNCNVLYANVTLIILNSSLNVFRNNVTLFGRFLDKIGRRWLLDAVIINFKIGRFLAYDRP